MSIKTEQDKKKDLTTFIYMGETSFDEVFNAVKAYYEGSPSRYTLWDARGTTLNHTAEEFHELNTFMQNFTPKRPGGKTAYVVGDDESLGTMLLQKTLVEIAGLPVQFEVFRSMKDARQWLKIDLP
jgi:hypothetical protein